MNKLSTTIFALVCIVGATNVAQANDSATDIEIDSVLNELSTQSNRSPALVKKSSEPVSLANQSPLLEKNQSVNDSSVDMLSHLTNVASTSVNRFKQTGRASWYGDKFHGRSTASGERFNMYSMTAAHPSLPFNTLLKVINKNNGKSVIVKVNDRGGFVGNRVLDLSYGAAKKIGLLTQGVANVAIERINTP